MEQYGATLISNVIDKLIFEVNRKKNKEKLLDEIVIPFIEEIVNKLQPYFAIMLILYIFIIVPLIIMVYLQIKKV